MYSVSLFAQNALTDTDHKPLGTITQKFSHLWV